MNKDLIDSDYIKMVMHQLGATSVQKFDSHMNIVKFQITGDIEVSYVFNITKNNKYFLQRMQPYAITHGKFSTAEEIINFIELDVTKFRNAAKSNNFEKFLKITSCSNNVVSSMDALFLNHNVSSEVMDELIQDIANIRLKIDAQFQLDNKIHDHTTIVGSGAAAKTAAANTDAKPEKK